MIAHKDLYSDVYKIGFCRGTCNFTPIDKREVFPNPCTRKPIERANVLMYIDKEGIEDPRDSTRYLGIELAEDPYFNVVLSSEKDASLAKNADVVVTRFDPPVNDEFLKDLKRYDDDTRVFVNNPDAQKYFSNKKYIEDIAREHPELFPQPQIFASCPEDVVKFLKEYEDEKFVSKPVYGFGGEGIVRVNPQGKNIGELEKIANDLFEQCPEGVIVQSFIDNIAEYGDKRVQIVNGSSIGAVLRKPMKGEFLCNLKKGGSYGLSEVSKGDNEIIEKIADLLEEKGVYWAGLDIVGPYLGEINAVSPGLLYAFDDLSKNVHGKGSAVNQVAEEIKQDVQDKYIEYALQRL